MLEFLFRGYFRSKDISHSKNRENHFLTASCCYNYKYCLLCKYGNKLRMVAERIYDGLTSIASSTSSSDLDDKSLCNLIRKESNKVKIIELVLSLPSELRNKCKSMGIASVLYVQMHCEMIKTMKG